jgi:hypothetical protein|tara:strand:+ start:54 stop:374 length:321 start_codon:yes stop_codon:yes gene_type:complete
MKVEYKSMFLGIALGVVGVFTILFLLGDVETEFSFSTGENENKMDKNIDIRIEKTVENGQDFTNVVVKGGGDVTKEDLDKELERLFNEHGINKNDSNINIEMEIDS